MNENEIEFEDNFEIIHGREWSCDGCALYDERNIFCLHPSRNYSEKCNVIFVEKQQ